MAEAKVTLAHKKNLRDAETANKAGLLARIKAATGVDYTFEIEPKFDDFVIALIKGQSPNHERVGEGFYNKDEGYLAHVAQLLEKSCKDDMIKEAVVEATPNKKIVLHLVHNGDEVPDDKCIAFKDGAMNLYVTPKYFYSWMSTYSKFDLTQIL